jgi:modulator of FtsH protease
MSLADLDRIARSWHDFFVATAGGAAALLGLLFVAVSLNLDDIVHAARPDLRVLAEQSFSNFLFALVVALLLLVPAPYANPASTEGVLVSVGAIGLIRIVRRALRALRRGQLAWGPVYTLRRLGAPAGANACLLIAAILLARADEGAFYWLLAATLVFLLSAADSSWDLLVRVGAERHALRSDPRPEGSSGRTPGLR